MTHPVITQTDYTPVPVTVPTLARRYTQADLDLIASAASDMERLFPLYAEANDIPAPDTYYLVGIDEEGLAQFKNTFNDRSIEVSSEILLDPDALIAQVTAKRAAKAEEYRRRQEQARADREAAQVDPDTAAYLRVKERIARGEIPEPTA